MGAHGHPDRQAEPGREIPEADSTAATVPAAAEARAEAAQTEAVEAASADPVAAEVARARLVRSIVAGGGLADPRWRVAFEQVPRHLFVPYFYSGEPGGYERLWGQDPDPERRARWLEGVYEDVPLATRLRDGELISSSSQPSLMALMLDALEVADGDTVLEIGAGSGYNAGLLAHRLGAERVTTVDLDPEITESARTHLAAAGYRPTVVTGDGARGCPARAPFDRILATCALPAVPLTWLAQSRPGGIVLAPLATGLIALRVTDATHAEGRFLPTPAYFVPLRGGDAAEHGRAADGEGAGGSGRFPRRPLRTGGLPRGVLRNDSFHFLLTLTAGRLDPREAFELWQHEGRPPRERYGVTLHEGREWGWLDRSDGPYSWPMSDQD
ncbi:methyltransferase domain-containing protein [Streptomyces sp. H27-D2]|uniref:methyltransferase domain-containing protein n=1 Tax=Streptomyces sp. H27-D2 TaxID=3046304 RepID=UPI002DBDD63A|nr:methyltransferase domain-containing protein [Streptomyces sp. H27-D2]MEC4020751.1 methyltransferase domain-containing protein [Streptomyces sp. H27-D2]